MAKTKPKTLTVKIKTIHGYLNQKRNKVVATIKFNDDEPAVNIRKCWIDEDTGELKTGQGIILTESELDALVEILASRDKSGKLPTVSQDGRKAVNFNSIFESAADIVEKRDAGYTTVDGYIRLSERPGGRRRRRGD